MRKTLTQSALVVWVALMVAASIAYLALLSEDIDSTVGILVAALCSVIVGAILTLKVPSNSVGPLALLAGSAWIVYQFGIGYGRAVLAAAEGSWPGAYLAGWMGSWAGAFFPLGVTTLILCFPTGRPVGWWRVLLIGPLAGAVSTVTGAVVLWGLPLATLVDNNLVSEATGYGLVDAGFIVGFIFAIPATLSVVARYRRAGRVERQQIKWLLAATIVFAVAFILGATSDDSNETFWWVLSAALAAIPIAILIAVLRYRLYEIDRILSRTVSYVVVIGLLAGVYLLGLTAMANFLPSDSSLSVAVSTLVVAALFNPLRRRVQAWVERRFNRSRYDAQKVMDQFSGSLRQDLDLDTVVRGWVGVVSETMEPVSISVWVRNDFGTMER